jgi:CRISPR-associated protein Csb2
MSLVLDVEYLMGVAFAARGQAIEAPDWPPQPDRVFSALVATWAAHGEKPEERRALEWLEAQSVPEVSASAGYARSAATVFVPPNDPASGRVGDRSVLPSLRRRQPRRFPAYRPDNSVVQFVWRNTGTDGEIIARLNALAADTSYLGHSASLVRCRFRGNAMPPPGEPPRRRIYPGRLAELQAVYAVGRRPNPGDSFPSHGQEPAAVDASVFSDRWLVLEHAGGAIPDLRAAPLVAKALHKAIMSAYRRIGMEAEIPATVSGHAADGAPLRDPHLAFAPLAFVGSRFADGTIYGFALIPPRGTWRTQSSSTPFKRSCRTTRTPTGASCGSGTAETIFFSPFPAT